MRILVLTSLISWSAARAEPVPISQSTLRRVARVTKDICEGYLDLLNPIVGVRELRARARSEHNRAIFSFEDDLARVSTHQTIRPLHRQDRMLRAAAAREHLAYRVLIVRRRLYVDDLGLVDLARGTALLIDPDRQMVVSVFGPEAPR